MKKVAWDWAKGIFTAVSIVFFVFLKLVNPGDAIENVIIDQIPVLEGLDVTGPKIAKILKQFGPRCLLILDGLDEHALGQNEDVIRIMKGQKYLFCNVIVTSRPHSTRDIQKYFQTVVSVEGFTYSEAEKFACRILSDRHKIDQVLRFNPGRGRDRSPVHNVPILLSFICLLVREDDIDLSKDTTDIGEIYTRMVRCLYRKFTIRKGIEYKVSHFINLLKSLGKLALETLLSENPFLKRKEVIAEVGEEAFDYGLLVGHEDALRFIPDETADIFVSFPHRTILEFLGSFCFIWRLNEGENIEDILGADNETPIFLTNPLFLQFCLWFLQKSDEMFSFLRKQELYKTLVVYAAQKVDHEVLFLRVITNSFSALDNFPVELFGNLSGGGQNEALLNFFGDILSECRSAQHLVFDLGFPIDWVLSSVETNLKSLKSIEIERSPSGDPRFIPKQYSLVVYRRSLCARIDHLNTNQTDDVNNKLIVVIHTEGFSKRDDVIKTCLKHCANIEKRICVHVQFSNVDTRGHGLASFLEGRLDELDLMGRYSKIVCNEELPLCPKLTHLSLRVIDLCDVVEGRIVCLRLPPLGCRPSFRNPGYATVLVLLLSL